MKIMFLVKKKDKKELVETKTRQSISPFHFIQTKRRRSISPIHFIQTKRTIFILFKQKGGGQSILFISFKQTGEGLSLLFISCKQKEDGQSLNLSFSFEKKIASWAISRKKNFMKKNAGEKEDEVTTQMGLNVQNLRK